MHKLVLLRHGESTWNKENRFTGWTDVDLSAVGIEEARAAGRLIKSAGFEFDIAYTSVLKRAIRTLWIALDEMDRLWLPVEKSWRLNERHYGDLQGLNKAEMAAKFGEQQVLVWRRSYDIPPPALKPGDPRSEASDPRYVNVPVPLSECLKDTVERVVPYWERPRPEAGRSSHHNLRIGVRRCCRADGRRPPGAAAAHRQAERAAGRKRGKQEGSARRASHLRTRDLGGEPLARRAAGRRTSA